MTMGLLGQTGRTRGRPGPLGLGEFEVNGFGDGGWRTGHSHVMAAQRQIVRDRGFDAFKIFGIMTMKVPKYPWLPSGKVAMTVSPIKVSAETKEQIRVAAALLNCGQSEFVGRAVDEYTQRHADELRAGIAGASAALALGDDAAIAYLAGEDVETLNRVTGDQPSR